MVLAALWVEGQVRPLAASSIDYLLGEMTGSDASIPTSHCDEAPRRYSWHLGVVAWAIYWGGIAEFSEIRLI